jgi:hypothetical protein
MSSNPEDEKKRTNYFKEYRERNRVKIREYDKQYYALNKEKIKEEVYKRHLTGAYDRRERIAER